MNTIYKFLIILCIYAVSANAFGEGIHDHIRFLSRAELEQWALSTEQYHREINNITVLGGLHDYINKASNEHLINYINSEVKEHPEINNLEAMKQLTLKYQPKKEEQLIGGGIHDHIRFLSRKELENWALATEQYHREVKQTPVLGGLHDYIDKVTNEHLINYINNEVNEHPEINNVEAMKALSLKYQPRQEKKRLGEGIHDYVRFLSRKELEQWALTTEKYHREINDQQHLMGGLHDYIANVSNEHLLNYINNEVKEHPEINNVDTMKALNSKYHGTSLAEFIAEWTKAKMGNIIDTFKRLQEEKEKKSEKAPLGGLHDYIRTLPREKLVSWALAIEKYMREEKNLNLKGGIHDYIHKLDEKSIAAYILKWSKVYGELNSKEKLDEISTKYETN